MSRLLTEAALNVAAVVNAAIDSRRGVNTVLEDDGHLTADVLLGEGTEAASAVGRQGEIDLPLTGIVGVAILSGTAQVAPGDHGGAIQDVPHLASVLRGGAAI